MIQSILLLLAIAAVWYVIIWSLRNDGAASIEDETGFIRLRRVKDEERTPSEAPGDVESIRRERRVRGRVPRGR